MSLKYLLSSLLLLAFLFTSANAQSFYTDCSTNTGNSATLIIPASINPTLDGSPLPQSTEIAVHTSNDLCAGVGIWNGSSLSLTVWGDDAMTGDTDGFQQNEQIRFRLWTDGVEIGNGTGSVSVSYDASQPFLRSDGLYGSDAIYSLSSFSAEGPAPPSEPSAPSLTQPANGATGVSPSVSLTWTSVTDADSYRLQVAPSADFAAPIVNESGITSTSFNAAGLAQETTYHWRVRAANDAGSSSWSDVRSFTTENGSLPAPGAPALSSPENGADDISTSVTLEWADVAEASSYRLQVAVTSDFASTTIDQSGLTATSVGTSDLAHETTYHWRVRAANDSGTSPWSAVRSFTTEVEPLAAPESPALTAPENGASDLATSVSFAWAGVADAASYRLQVAASSDFTSTAIDESGLTATSFDADGLAYETTYHWRVRAANDAGESSWSDARSFTTESAPLAVLANPSLSTPVNGALIASVEISFAWSASENAETYYVEVSTREDYSGDALQFQTTNTFAKLAGLNEATTYYWHVRAMSSNGASSWSPTSSFTTVSSIATPIPVFPQDGSEELELTLALEWQEIDNATAYQVQVFYGDQADTSTAVVDSANVQSTTLAITLEHASQYSWRVRAYNGQVSSEWSTLAGFGTKEVLNTSTDDAVELPSKPALSQNFPNPFNPSTTIPFELPHDTQVKLVVFDLLGKEVVTLQDGYVQAGAHQIHWEAGDIPTGMYAYVLETPTTRLTRTLILVK